MLSNRGRHHANRARAGDQHIFAHQVEGERRVHRVAKRVKDRGQIVRDIVRDFEGVKRRDHQIFRKTARAVYAHTDGIAAQVRTTGAAVTAVATGDVTFTGDAVADLKTAHFLADTDHFAHVFMPHNHRYRDRLLRPFIPVVDMHVGAANRGFANFNQQIVVAEFRFRNVGHPDPFFRFQFR